MVTKRWGVFIAVLLLAFYSFGCGLFPAPTPIEIIREVTVVVEVTPITLATPAATKTPIATETPTREPTNTLAPTATPTVRPTQTPTLVPEPTKEKDGITMECLHDQGGFTMDFPVSWVAFPDTMKADDKETTGRVSPSFYH